MGPPIDFATLLWLVAGAALLFVFAYYLVRVMSFAHYRTKLEYFRALLKEMAKGDHGHGR